MSEKGSEMPDTPEQPPQNPDNGGIVPSPESKGSSQPETPNPPVRPTNASRNRTGYTPRTEGGDVKEPASSQPDQPENPTSQPEAEGNPSEEGQGENPTTEGKKELTPPSLTPEQEAQRNTYFAEKRRQIDANPETADLSEEQKKQLAFTLGYFGNPEVTPEEILYLAQKRGLDKEDVREQLSIARNPNADEIMTLFEESQPETTPEEEKPAPTPEPEPEKRDPMPLTDEQKERRDEILPEIRQQFTDPEKGADIAKELGVMNEDGTLNEEKVKDYAGDLIRLQDPTTSLPELQRVISDWNLDRQQVARVLFSARNLASSSPDEIKNFVQALNLDRRVVRDALKKAGHHSDAEIDEAMADMNGLTDDEMKEQTAFDDLPPEAKEEIGKFQEEMDDLQDAVKSGEDQGELKKRAVGLFARFNNWRKGRESSRHILMNTWTLSFFSALVILIWSIKTGGNALAGLGKR